MTPQNFYPHIFYHVNSWEKKNWENEVVALKSSRILSSICILRLKVFRIYLSQKIAVQKSLSGHESK